MNVNTRQVGPVTVVDVEGKITLTDGAAVLRDTVKELLGQGQNRLLMNFAEVAYMDSSGIGELVSAYRNVASQGGSLKLLSLTKRVRDVLQITKLITVFEVFEDEESALRSFS